MKNYIEKRVLSLADYIIRHKCTVRNAAKEFNISKSTVHKDVAYRLEHINPKLYQKVRLILDDNRETRHIRGGNATKQKYLALHKS
ncbi:MAG: sporulation transcriptional regulator SpoIIID [Clostridia bacterium]|nr:sporulation transcriptional regulator SpoIIID [Clostridia bacterium]